MSNDRGKRMQALRERLELTQSQLEPLPHSTVSRIESGQNAANTLTILGAYAARAHVTVDDIRAYRDGELSLDGLLTRKRQGDPRAILYQALGQMCVSTPARNRDLVDATLYILEHLPLPVDLQVDRARALVEVYSDAAMRERDTMKLASPDR